MKAWVKAISRFNDFQGRSSLKELWQYYLWNYTLSFILSYVDVVLRLYVFRSLEWGAYLSISFLLLTLLPSMSIAIRRLHDIGKCGWFFLVPIYGPLICLFKKGDISANKYGPPTDSIESGKNDFKSYSKVDISVNNEGNKRNYGRIFIYLGVWLFLYILIRNLVEFPNQVKYDLFDTFSLLIFAFFTFIVFRRRLFSNLR